MSEKAKPLLNRVQTASSYSKNRRYIDTNKMQQFGGKPPANPQSTTLLQSNSANYSITGVGIKNSNSHANMPTEFATQTEENLLLNGATTSRTLLLAYSQNAMTQ